MPCTRCALMILVLPLPCTPCVHPYWGNNQFQGIRKHHAPGLTLPEIAWLRQGLSGDLLRSLRSIKKRQVGLSPPALSVKSKRYYGVTVQLIVTSALVMLTGTGLLAKPAPSQSKVLPDLVIVAVYAPTGSFTKDVHVPAALV